MFERFIPPEIFISKFLFLWSVSFLRLIIFRHSQIFCPRNITFLTSDYIVEHNRKSKMSQRFSIPSNISPPSFILMSFCIFFGVWCAHSRYVVHRSVRPSGTTTIYNCVRWKKRFNLYVLIVHIYTEKTIRIEKKIFFTTLCN